MKRKFNLVVVLLCVFVIMFTLSTPVLAATPYDSYIYDANGNIVDSPIAATPVESYEEFGDTSLKQPQDLFVDTKNNLYIADTGNNRILKLNDKYELLAEYKNFESNGGVDSFKSPSGVYVDSKDNIYVADTENARIVKLNGDGELISIFEAPKSDLLPSDFNYRPIKVVCDTSGRLFVVSRGFNMGLLELDHNGDFVQTLGASDVTYSLIDVIWRLLSTKAQKERMSSFIPAEYNNISIDQENFIFATTGTSDANSSSSDAINPVRKLSAKGTDVLRRVGNPNADLEHGGVSIKGPSYIVDVVNLENGIYGILDQKRGRAFVYNGDGMLLFMFGGLGQSFGTLSSPTSIVFFNNHFIILDASKNALVSYALTDYGNLIFEAEKYRNENDFENEQTAWEKVLSYNENSPLALVQMGLAAYKQRSMTEAMDYFKRAGDQENYSKAFQFYRRELINRYFTVGGIVLILIVVIIVIIWIFIKIHRKNHPKIPKQTPFKYAFHVILRPFDGFWDLKYEKRGSIWVSFAIMGLACLAMILNSQFVGFIFQPNPEQRTNFLINIAIVMAPTILWIVSTRCVTSLMSGEGSLKDIITATGYSLLPIVIVVPFATILSNIFTAQEGAVYYFFMALALVWTLWLIFASVKQTHDYSVGRTVFIILLSILVIAIIVFIGLLCVALVQQMVAFVTDIFNEISIR